MFRLQVTIMRQTFQYMDMTCSVPCRHFSSWTWHFQCHADISVHGHDIFSDMQTFLFTDMTCSVPCRHFSTWTCHGQCLALTMTCSCTEMSAWWWLLVTEICSKLYIIEYIVVFLTERHFSSKYILWDFSGGIWQFGLRVIWCLSIAQCFKNTHPLLGIGVVKKYGLHRDYKVRSVRLMDTTISLEAGTHPVTKTLCTLLCASETHRQ